MQRAGTPGEDCHESDGPTQAPSQGPAFTRRLAGLAPRDTDIMTEQVHSQLTGVEGEVKWFDPRKGFGFIVGPDKQDIFAHYTVIEGDGFRALRDGSLVEYDAVKTDKGWKATRIVRREEAEVHVVNRRAYARTPRR